MPLYAFFPSITLFVRYIPINIVHTHLARETINHDNARRILTRVVRKFVKYSGCQNEKYRRASPTSSQLRTNTGGIFQDSDFIGSISFRFSGKLTPAQTLLVHWISDISQALARNAKGKETGGRSRFRSKLHGAEGVLKLVNKIFGSSKRRPSLRNVRIFSNSSSWSILSTNFDPASRPPLNREIDKR